MPWWITWLFILTWPEHRTFTCLTLLTAAVMTITTTVGDESNRCTKSEIIILFDLKPARLYTHFFIMINWLYPYRSHDKGLTQHPKTLFNQSNAFIKPFLHQRIQTITKAPDEGLSKAQTTQQVHDIKNTVSSQQIHIIQNNIATDCRGTEVCPWSSK